MDITMEQVIQAAVALIAGWAGKHYYSRWTEVKTDIHEIRKVFDAIDNALYDGKVDEQSFREKYEAQKNSLLVK